MEVTKKSAVEWLQVEIDNKDMGEIPMWLYEFIEQAKKMEKQQIKDAWDSAYTAEGFFNAEQYYNETYGKAN
jgi:alpha-amylase/alpha-mannosidase (GH57 family)